MLHIHRLPAFTFVKSDGSEQALTPDIAIPRVRAVSEFLRAHVAPRSAIAILHPSGPELVINWLASLNAGLRPLIMQYPTKKQSRQYWADSVRNTADIAGLSALIADDYCV